MASATRDGPEPLLVIAGAGAGKTNMLAHRVAHLILGGADPKRIMLATFSRRAAAELNRRVQRLLQRRLAAEAAAQATPSYAGTFHSIGARLLREYAVRLGLDPQFTIHDREDSGDLMNWARHAGGPFGPARPVPDQGDLPFDLFARRQFARAAGETLAQALSLGGGARGGVARRCSPPMSRRSSARRCSITTTCCSISRRCSPSRKSPPRSRAASTICWSTNIRTPTGCRPRSRCALRPRGRGLTVVGDDAQSIYSFRAATVRNILDFPNSFDPPARVVTLDRNYRSTQPILAASNAVIGLSPERYAKDLWTDRGAGVQPALVTVAEESDQARYVATRVLENREAGETLKSQAVLFRAAHHSAALELELTRRNIPFVKFGGLKFLDAAHIKDTLALLRFAENPRDRIAGFRVAQLLPGIGPGERGEDRRRGGGRTTASRRCARSRRPPRRARRSPNSSSCSSASRTARPGRSISARSIAWRRAHLEESYDNFVTRAADLDALERIAATYPSRERFLSELTLDPPDATSDEAGPPLSRRGLSDPVDDPFGQGAGMEVGVRAQLRRRLHPLRSRDRIERRDRGGAAAALCRDDARARRARPWSSRSASTCTASRATATAMCSASRTRFMPPSLLKHFERVAWPPPQAEPQRAARRGAEGGSGGADAGDVALAKAPDNGLGAANFPSFFANFSKFSACFSKFFQKFLWRFWGISRGYGAKKAFCVDSKFFAPTSPPPRPEASFLHSCN